MQIESIIKQITFDFISLWNSNEIEKALSYLKEDIVVISPFVKTVYPNNLTNKIIGKNNVKQYWLEVIKLSNNMKFELESFNKYENEIFTISKIDNKDQKLYTWFKYNEYGKIIELRFEYI